MRGALGSVAGAALLLKGCSGIEGKQVEANSSSRASALTKLRS